MTPMGTVITNTIFWWLPILSFFYLPNTLWGIVIKVIAGYFLISFIYSSATGRESSVYGPASAVFLLNALWFTIINFKPPQWVGIILWFLIIMGFGTCYKILKKMKEEECYRVKELYNTEQIN